MTNRDGRRAKLKRLTIDDRESMLKSRALPEDFDTAQTLNYAYDTPLHGGLGGPSSFFHSSNPEYDKWRPFTTGRLSLSGETNGNISPTSVVSSLIDSSFSVPGTTSPISPSSEMSHVFTPPTSHRTSPRTSGSLPRSSSFAALHQAARRRHGSPLQQRLVRSRASSSAFPMHHTTTPVEQAVHFPVIPLHAVQSEPYPQQTLSTYNGNGPGGDPNTSTYHAAQHVTAGHAANDTAWPDLATDICGCSTSCSNDTTGHQMYGSLGAPSHTQQACTVRQVQSAPLAVPPEFLQPEWAAPYQPSEVCFPTALDFGEAPQTNQVWLPPQASPPYQTQFSTLSGFHAHTLLETCYGHGNHTPKPRRTEAWPYFGGNRLYRDDS
ncbi:MAG: hypothetical protein Q9171_001353 [Xanthocarpia ochracea]